MNKKKLDHLRKVIDDIDGRLLHLINQRAEQVISVARIKRKMQLKVFDPVREKEIYVNITNRNSGPLPQDAIVRIFERIIDESRRLERLEVYDKDK